MMLRHLGEPDAGDRLEAAVAVVLAEGVHLTAGPPLAPGTTGPPRARFQVADAVIARL